MLFHGKSSSFFKMDAIIIWGTFKKVNRGAAAFAVSLYFGQSDKSGPIAYWGRAIASF